MKLVFLLLKWGNSIFLKVYTSSRPAVTENKNLWLKIGFEKYLKQRKSKENKMFCENTDYKLAYFDANHY